MMRSAQHAFSLLRDCLTQMFADAGQASAKNAVELDALFIWSTMHGLASILQTSAIRTLALPSAVLAATASHTLQRIGIALSTGPRAASGLKISVPYGPSEQRGGKT
jgi:hypothetical protein